MNILAIDTSTDLASIALFANDETYQETHQALRMHAKLLLPSIEKLLLKADISINQLNAIAFCKGPGSFTGLRISCSVAKGLAYANDLPLYPISSLEAIAFKSVKPVIAMLDARMNQVYWACFKDGQYLTEEQVTNPEDIILPSSDFFELKGVGYEAYQALLPQETQKRILNVETIYPEALSMISMVKSGKVRAVSANEAIPVYIRNQIIQGEPRG